MQTAARPAANAPHRLAGRAADLLIDAPTVSPAHTNQDVFQLFDHHPALSGLPVIEDGRPIGLINRNIFMDSFARPFHREVYSHKSCIAFMDKSPLVVEAATPLQELSFRAVEHGGKTLTDGFIVTADGDYTGMGTGIDLVRAISELQAEKNRQVMESIAYASVIQRSFLRPSREALQKLLPDHLLLWEPRDTVGGDAFYFTPRGAGFVATLFDCTGHGVPGAFMTLIMASFIENALIAEPDCSLTALLGRVNRGVKRALGQIDHSHADESESQERSDDGMDGGFLAWEPATRTLRYAGARTPLLLLRPGAAEVEQIDGDRAGVGYAGTPLEQAWTEQALTLEPGTLVCVASDGLYDQPGGPKRIAFGRKRLYALLLEHRAAPLPQLRQALVAAYGDWQGEEPRRDDLSVLAFRI